MGFLMGVIDMWRHPGASQILHVYIPGMYLSSPMGIVLLTILNIVLLALITVCAIPLDMFFLFGFCNVPLAPAIVQTQMEEVTQLLRARRSLDGDDVAIVRRHFLHFIGIHHKYNE